MNAREFLADVLRIDIDDQGPHALPVQAPQSRPDEDGGGEFAVVCPEIGKDNAPDHHEIINMYFGEHPA